MTAHYQVHGQVAVITFDNPPVNGLGLATRLAVAAGLQQALETDAVQAIVITGAGKAFSGGADIREFNSPKALAEPSLHTLIDMVERSSKPVIAAINAVCMGGGLELSLACNYRIARADAKIALPEVKLGLVPGAGGTQRLPRMVGLEQGLNMIVSGNPVSADKLAGTALFNELVAAGQDVLAAALLFAGKVAALRPLPRVRDYTIDYPQHQAFLQFARNNVKAQAGPFPAPLKCVEAVAASVTMPFDAGIRFERELFFQLVQSAESKALRHAFFSERLAGKLADVGADTPLRAIHSAAVIGTGTMGAGIAMNFANAGIAVTLLATGQQRLEATLAKIGKSYEASVKKGRLTPQALAQRMALIAGTLDYQALAQADIVVEAVYEDIAVKQTVFEKLDAVMKPGAILASNTSSLDLNRIAAFTGRPQDVLGLHFFSPANVMKLLEIVRAEKTGKDVLATALALAKKLGKTAVVAGICDGFIGNRMLEQYVRQAGFLLEDGCLPQQVDKAIEQFGFAMGPFRVADMVGIDVSWQIRQRRYVDKPDVVYPKFADRLYDLGRFGQKSGAGWYDYRPGERAAQPSETVNQMIVAHSQELGVTRRQISDAEIVERLVYALVNEGARILEQGIAQRASDIDMVYLSGYGFPLVRGGPMFYADTVGLSKVAAGMAGFANGRHGESWAVAPLLARLAAEGKSFNS